MEKLDQSVILYDGYCILCNRLIRLIIHLDRRRKIRFSALDSEYATQFFHDNPTIEDRPDSIVFIDDGKVYMKSNAVLKIASRVGGILNIVRIAYLMPLAWRDRLYDYIARKRYKWFGRNTDCQVPEKEVRDRFIT